VILVPNLICVFFGLIVKSRAFLSTLVIAFSTFTLYHLPIILGASLIDGESNGTLLSPNGYII
jgi:hypothetical protein